MAYAPILTTQQIDRIRPFAKARTVSAGDVLYNPGDDTPPVFVVIRGQIQIVAIAGGHAQIVTTYSPGQFSGELLIISGRRSIYRCQAIEAGELLQLNARELREVIGRDSELNDIFMETFLTRRLSLKAAGHGNVVILGSRHSARTLALREFLTRDGSPFAYLDLDTDPTAQEFLDRFGVGINEIPVVVCNNRKILRNPSTKELADCLGFNLNLQDSHVRDLVVVGAGPAGLSTAVSAASEGIDVLVIEKSAPGGQAGASSKIENYLGFPTGLSGHELASRAIAQAEKFGARIMVAQGVVKLKCDRRPYKVVLENGQEISARVIVLATGAQYNKPPKETFDRVDHEIWRALWPWARRRHPKKSRAWVKKHCFPALGSRAWTFACKTEKQTPDGKPVWLRLVYASETKIRRHVKIRRDANPFDPQCQPYFVKRAFQRKHGNARPPAEMKPLRKPAPLTRGFGAA